MKVFRKDQGEIRKGTTFSGEVELQTLLKTQVEGGIQLTVVRFDESARTHWHVHPGEQVLYILAGNGQVGTESQVVDVEPGDVVYAAPGEKHWHGAAPGGSMTHISITNVGSPQWLEPV